MVVVDLDTGTVTRIEDGEIRGFVPMINELAAALRAAGGTVAWLWPRSGYLGKIVFSSFVAQG